MKRDVPPIAFSLHAAYVGETIDLRAVQETLRKYTALNRDHPLVLEYVPHSYAVLTKFGVVVFWNVQTERQQDFLRELAPCVTAKHPDYPYRETFEVAEASQDEPERVTTDGAFLREMNLDRIKIVSYAIAQSVALERYERDLEKSLLELETVVSNLKNKGKALLREKDLLKQVGRALTVKQTAIAHLSLFDKPDEVWESQELERLYLLLRGEFDLQARSAALDDKIEFLSETSRMLMEFLAEKKSEFLEVVIIILIVIEMVPLAQEFVEFLEKVFK